MTARVKRVALILGAVIVVLWFVGGRRSSA